MYEEFKRELYCNIVQLEEVRGKLVKLLEPHMICSDAETIRLIRRINFARYGKADILVREDIISVSWCPEGIANMKYWAIKELYERYQRAGWQNVLPEIVLQLQETERNNHRNSMWSGTYEQTRYRQIVRPLNYYYHRESLENCIYWKYGDIALVLSLLLYDLPDDCMTLEIKRSMTENWGISDEMLLTNALLNTRSLMPPRLYHGNTLRKGLGSGAGVFMPEDGRISVFVDAKDELEGIQGYRLSTVKWFNGAVAIFYPYVRESLAQMLGGDFFVGFTSVHEAVIHPARYKVVNEMKAAILHNNVINEEREMLTNCVYRYCSTKKMLLEV